MDAEGYARRLLARGVGDGEIVERLAERIVEVKGADPAYAREFARAVLIEVNNTKGLTGDLVTFVPAGVSMGEFGVGSRGSGDFYAHRKIAEIIGRTGAAVGVDEMDDSGAVVASGRYIVSTVDGMHSRLSDFPFLAGFHATRATLRDIYVMGARPVSLFSDIHVADDGDVAKVFDYTAGIAAVGDAMGIPLVTGSTLRIGGDMVLGTRMTGAVGAVGVADRLTARKEMRPGDLLLMTEGAGGGTIATSALYYGYPEVVEETINLAFLKASEALLSSPCLARIHAMTDVTNGGLRGDAYEMAQTARCRIVVEEQNLRRLVNPAVLALLDRLKIDYLGVSLDALLIAAPPDAAGEIMAVVRSAGVEIAEIGRVEEGKPGAVLRVDGEDRDFSPRFRESAYTPLKKVVEKSGRSMEEMKAGIDRAAAAAIEKKRRIVERLRG
ncbi:MAG: AIR synthase-related protein [Methanomicrobiales archaeon]|nr:AIR synthase-related protein [Methanomicrobiales archaeon]MDI6877158.1 AIR synthase-related protein [Methanomicrobiales archaeon]